MSPLRTPSWEDMDWESRDPVLGANVVRRARALASRLLLLILLAAFVVIPGSEGSAGAVARGDELASQHLLLSAIGSYQEAVERPGGDPAAHFRLGTIYLRRGQWQEAIQAFQLAEVAGNDGRELMLSLAMAQDKAGNLQASLDTLRADLSIRPSDAEAWTRLVDRAARSGLLPAEISQRLAGVPAPIDSADLSQEVLYLEGACLLGPDSEAGIAVLRQAASGWDKTSAAAANELLAAATPGDGTGTALAVASALLAQGFLGPARAYLERDGGGPHEAERQALLGYELMQTGQLDQAEAALRRSLQLDANLQVGQFMMGSFLRLKGDAEGATKLLETAARQKPANPAIYMELANALVDMGDYGTAEQALNLAVQAAPESGDLRLAIASFYVDRQYRIDMALPQATEAVRILGRSASSLSALAWALHLSGRSRDALSPMQEAVSKDAESPLMRYRLGSIYEELGRQPEAREQYLMVRELDGSDNYWKRAQGALNGM